MTQRPDWDEQFSETDSERAERQRKTRQNARVKAIAASHTWDGPLVSLGHGDVATCSVCGDDASTDRMCHGKIDPRDPDYSQEGMFVLHNCWKCQNGAARCVSGNPRQCEYPHARND